MKVKCLGTGSDGNCYIVQSQSGCFILDAGICFDTIVKNVNLNKVDFGFVSHCHRDHSKSAHKLLVRGVELINGSLFNDFEKVKLRGKGRAKYQIYAFPILHDVANSGLIVIDKGSKEMLLYCTDFSLCEYDLSKFKFTDVLVECNYLENNMNNLENFKIVRQIKNHMGLAGTITFLKTLDLTKVKTIHLIHISQTVGDETIMAARILKVFDKNVAVCKQFGGVEFYGRS